MSKLNDLSLFSHLLLHFVAVSWMTGPFSTSYWTLMRAFHLFCLIAVSLSWSEGDFTFIESLPIGWCRAQLIWVRASWEETVSLYFDRVCVSQSTWKQRAGLDASVLQSIHVFCATSWAVFARYLSFLIMCLKNAKLLCECFTVQVRSLRLILKLIVTI